MRTLLAATLLLCTAASQAPAQPSAPRPDLHAGGPKPSQLPNHETTLVTLPGLHLTGTTVTVKGACTLHSFKVVSDNQITMMIESNRQIDDTDDGCFLSIHRGTYVASTYVILDLTEAEWSEKHAKEGAANKAKGEAYMAHLGKQWTLHYADGSSDTFTAQPADPGQLPDFQNASGITAKIMTTNDNKVMVITGSCMRSGKLLNNQVKDGTSMGDCKPAGSWTAQMK